MDDLSTKFSPSESVCIEYLCSFQNVLQMASSVLKAHLHTSRKIVNDSHTFLFREIPDLCCDCCLQFTNCLRIVLIHIIREIKIQGGGFKFGECAAHSISHFLLISLSLNRSLSQARESFVVWVWPHLSRTTVHLYLYLCVVPMMPKTSSVLPHSAFTRLEPPRFLSVEVSQG